MPTTTPWGMSQSKTKYAVGINFYTTASHGGFRVSPKKNMDIPVYMRNNNGWYEEDCEYAKVVVVFPEHFDDEVVARAKETLKTWFPDAYEQFFGTTIQEGESYVRDKENFMKRHKNDYIVVSAVTSDKHKDMVECYATKGGLRNSTAWETAQNFLVPEAEYQKRGLFGFVIDESKHENVSVF